MKQKIVLIAGTILTAIAVALFASCDNKEQDEIRFEDSEAPSVLIENANIHNQGLDYIKQDILKNPGVCSSFRLDSIFREFVNHKYGMEKAENILSEIAPVTKLMFNGYVPSFNSRNEEEEGFTNKANVYALEALKVSMGKISEHLSNFNENEIFDNGQLLESLQNIITETYSSYVAQSGSEADADALNKAMGVLYGSIEYWTNSDNVEIWTHISVDSGSLTKVIANSENVMTRGDDETKGKKVLTRKEWLEVVAAADAIGALLGIGVASTPAAAAASAAVALYYDVEE